MPLSRYFLTFGIVVLIGLGLVGGGVFLLVQRTTGTRVEATVIACTPTSRYGGGHCTGTWVTGGSVADGGHIVTGSIDGATSSDVGKTITVTASGDRAYTLSLTTPIVLLTLGLGIVIVLGVVVPLAMRRPSGVPGDRKAEAAAGAGAGPGRASTDPESAPASADPEPAPARSVDDVAREIRRLRNADRLAEAVALIGGLGPYGVNDEEDWDTEVGAGVLAAYADELAATDPAAAAALYRRAAQHQHGFTAGATSGGEGLARDSIAKQFQAKADALEPPRDQG